MSLNRLPFGRNAMADERDCPLISCRRETSRLPSSIPGSKRASPVRSALVSPELGAVRARRLAVGHA
jgi:hypothetical protein